MQSSFKSFVSASVTMILWYAHRNRPATLRPRSGQHLNHSCLYNLPEPRPSPPGAPCRTFSSTTRHRLRFARRTGPPSPLFVAHTLCPSVWPERTQMEAHSVSAAPHNCAESLNHSWSQTQLNSKRGPRCCARASFCLTFAFVVLSPPYGFPAYVIRAALDCQFKFLLGGAGKRSCVFFKSSITRRSASQVCVPQLVL